MTVESKVSIVITTYRRSEFIRKAVQNVLNQTLADKLEIIVVDDNGLNTTEQLETFNILKEFIERKAINYYPLEKNSGACFARNFGAKNAKGKYISFFDDDDDWDPTKIEKQLKIMEANQGIEFVYCLQKAIHFKTGKTVYSIKKGFGTENIFQELLHCEKGSISTPNPLIKLNAIWAVGGFNENLPALQDIDLFLRITERFQVKFVPEFLHFALIHNKERISTNHKNKIIGFNHLLRNYSERMHIDTLKYIHSRIIVHSFWAKEKTQCLNSIEFIKGNNFLTLKIILFIIGMNNIFVRILIIMYFRIIIFLG